MISIIEKSTQRLLAPRKGGRPPRPSSIPPNPSRLSSPDAKPRDTSVRPRIIRIISPSPSDSPAQRVVSEIRGGWPTFAVLAKVGTDTARVGTFIFA